ncbi:hypothetical protein [uncultured Mediterranean phage uvMED]|nr:hypothetical protein [uncultured Mediterranean phage uvMED]
MALSPKYKFKDLSLIRWVNDLSHFKDRFNPQNNQYFGSADKPYRLQIENDDPYCFYDGLHRLVLTNYDIDLTGSFTDDMKIYFVDRNSETQLLSSINNDIENVYYVTLKANSGSRAGRLELRGGKSKFVNFLRNVYLNGIDHWSIISGDIVFEDKAEIKENTVFSQKLIIDEGLSVEAGYILEIEGTANIKYSLQSTSDGITYEIDSSQYSNQQATGDFAITTSQDYNNVIIDVELIGNSKVTVSQVTFSIFQDEDITFKYSDCVKFVDEPLTVIHTRNYFDRNGIKWSENPKYNWIRTTLPTKDLGLTDINPERTIEYLGKRNTPIAIESRNDESITYEFLVEGKASILDSIESLSGNVKGSEDQGGFYLDLKKLTPEGDMDREEDSINGTMTYLFHKNDDGSDVFIDDGHVFGDLVPIIISLSPANGSVFYFGIDDNFPLVVYYSLDVQLTNDLTKKIKIYKDNSLIETLTADDIFIENGNSLLIKQSQIYDVGEYRVFIDDDFVFENKLGEFGAKGIDDWTFSVIDPRVYSDVYRDVYS